MNDFGALVFSLTMEGLNRNYNMDCEKNLRLYEKLTLNNSYSL